jgi:hypothetical protein
MFEDFLNEVLDPLYFSEVSQEVHGKENWVFEEMWTYFKKKYQIHIPRRSPSTMAKIQDSNARSLLQLREPTQSSGGDLRHVCDEIWAETWRPADCGRPSQIV